MSLRSRYYWKGMKKSIHEHCTRCQVCAKHNIKTQQLRNEHFSTPPQPMEFIAMDLIGEFHPASSKGNRFALTAVCMLTGFTFCIPIKSKKAVSGPNYIDSFDESRSQCDCSAWASFYLFSGSTLRLIDIQVQPYAVTWNVYYINYLTFKREAAHFIKISIFIQPTSIVFHICCILINRNAQ